MNTNSETPPVINPDENLSLADLSTMGNIIYTASSRGAFKANEFQIVGKLNDKIAVILSNAKYPLINPPEEKEKAQ